MKKTSVILFLLLIVFCFTDCKKKRYPSDIPKWLKEKIDKMEKDSKGKGCENTECRTVEEYTDGSSTFYWINSSGATPKGYYIFNYNGDEQCIYHGGGASTSDPCYIGFHNNEFVRLIWQEN